MTDQTVKYFANPEDPELKSAIKHWSAEAPEGGVLAFIAEADQAGIPAVQHAFRETDYPMVGALFPELIWDGSFEKHGLLLSHFQKMPPYRLISGLSREDGESEAIASIEAMVVQHKDDGQSTLFLIFDALVANIASQLEQLYLRLADQVHYMGANAGSETFQPMNCLFDSKQQLQDAVLALLINDHGGARLEHGYPAPEQMIAATATLGNRIISINWRPAFEVYAELAQSHYGQTLSRENFYEMGVHFPFGIVRASGEILVRIPVALEEDGSLFCVGEVPENAVLTLLEAVEPDSYHTVEALAQHFNPRDEHTILNFYCAGRRLHLGEKASDELAALKQRLSPACLAGALSLGEIGSSRQGDYPLFHNATLVCSRWDGL